MEVDRIPCPKLDARRIKERAEDRVNLKWSMILFGLITRSHGLNI